MHDTAYYLDLAARYLMPTYGERSMVLVRGEGARVWDADGREYLDFLAGIAVNSLGHCHPAVTAAIREQAGILMHCSNLYLIPQQAELARRLCEVSFASRCFFANSGAEVNEGAVKLARLYSRTKYGAGRHEIVTMRNSFHGRTMALITATGQEKVQKGFEPLLDGFRYAVFNDLDSVLGAMTPATCAVMVEPVQGEGGVTAATPEFLRGLREICTERDVLLIFDEIQCGMGRTGRLFAHEHYGVTPDLMTLAKALGNGFPVGALLAAENCAETFTPGSHGTTFGGNPVACAAALAVLDVMERDGLAARAECMGAYLRGALAQRLDGIDTIKGYRGLGLMLGIELAHPGAEAVKKCAARGLLINCTMGNVLRIVPPLVVTEAECDRAAEILAEVLAEEAQNFHAAAAAAQTNAGGGA
ncbi:MAG: acetylornithine transaminase [Candidatus Sumerlaeaceae bacterium]|nr:acetylornithine transaminase [Candidatus Sumerlaeaceae bacterium]